MSLNLKGLNRAQVLACLYNASRPQGMGFYHYDAKPMTEQEAVELLKGHPYFDYLKGRVMKLDMSSDNIDPRLYDRDNGEGAAQRAIDAAAVGNDAAIKAAHRKGVVEAAANAIESMSSKPTITDEDGVHVYNLTLEDVKPTLNPKVNEALKANENA